MSGYRASAVLLGVALLGCAPPPAGYWMPETVAVERIDYAAWDALLGAHVRDGEVDYPALAGASEFAGFISLLRRARFTRETSEAQRLAFRINAYNASAIAGVLGGGSLEGRIGRARFFVFEQHAVGGEEISLRDLEDERIRSHGDARIHFALVCASRSCPELAAEAYVPERLDAQLDAAARRFINDAARNRFDAERREAWLSAIFDRYADDFVGEAGSVAAYVARYLDDASLAEALRVGEWEIEHLPYDWGLNGVAPAR